MRLHNGMMWTPTASSLEAADDRPIEQILRELARPWNAIVLREPDGTLIGTGPFRVARWEVGKAATLVANEEHWKKMEKAGSVEIQMGRDLRVLGQDLHRGKADGTDASIGATDVRRMKRGGRNAALVSTRNVPRRPCAKPSRSRSTKWSFAGSAQRPRGISPGSLPGGSAVTHFCSTVRGMWPGHANWRQAPRRSTSPMTGGIGVYRSIGERISVNAMEAGITMRPGNGMADVRLVMIPVTSHDELAALADIAVVLKAPFSFAAAPRGAERAALLDGFRVIPLFHLRAELNALRALWPDLPNLDRLAVTFPRLAAAAFVDHGGGRGCAGDRSGVDRRPSRI